MESCPPPGGVSRLECEKQEFMPSLQQTGKYQSSDLGTQSPEEETSRLIPDIQLRCSHGCRYPGKEKRQEEKKELSLSG